MHPGFVLALSRGYSLCSVCSRLGFHRFGPRRFDYERSYVMLLGALRKHLKNDCVAMVRLSASTISLASFPRAPCGIEEMGLSYVGVTRARKAVYVSASMQRRTNNGNYQVACPSCLTSLPGIKPVSWTVMDGEG